MIVGSIGFVLVAAGLLVTGALQGDETYYYLSIVASVLAALALVVGVRQVAGARDDDEVDARPLALRGPEPVVGRVALPRRPAAAMVGAAPERLAIGAEPAPALLAGALPDPPDEPPPQAVAAIESSRVARLAADVAVIDGRPRYHVVECMHLLGRDYERLPVSEAVDLGFTPCRACAPVTVLLAGVSRA